MISPEQKVAIYMEYSESLLEDEKLRLELEATKNLEEAALIYTALRRLKGQYDG